MTETNLFKALELSESQPLVDIDPHTKTSKLVDPVKESKVRGLTDTMTGIPLPEEFKYKSEKVKVEPRVISEMARFTIEEVEALTRCTNKSVLQSDIDKRTKMLLDVFNISEGRIDRNDPYLDSVRKKAMQIF